MLTISFQIGDFVSVLRACRLPKIEESLGVGRIERITQRTSGEPLYWISGFLCARAERELRTTTEVVQWTRL